MNTKQKAEAYDKLRIKAKQIYNKENDVLIIHTIEDLFPEFKEEFEDERMRKKLIAFLKTYDTLETSRYISWLEKQGKQSINDKPKFKIGDIISNGRIVYRIDNIVKNAIGQNCYFLVNVDMEKNDIRYLTVTDSEGKTSHIGETIWLCEQVDKSFEKQNEQKPYGQRKECSDCQFNYAGECKGSCQMKRNEQKPADKVKPKFKIGDWIILAIPGIKYPHLITDIRDGYYIFGEDNDRAYIASNDGVLKLWTIQDAKPGDVLINWNNTVFIFKAIEDETVKFHIAYNEKWDTIKTPSTKLSHMGLPEPQFEFHPATKEQRDLLFQKMKEAGYEWDAENLQLTKIFYVKELSDGINIDKQKTAEWSEEDKKKKLGKIEDEEYNGEDYGIDGLWHAMNILEKTLGKVSGYQTDDGFLEHQCAITAVKKLYKPKPDWGEEDERIYQSIIDDTVQENQLDSKQIDWLKSIKSRVQRYKGY